MKSQQMAIKSNTLLSKNVLENYKDAIDSFGGVICMAGHFGWSEATVYSWLRGKPMSITFAVRISMERPTLFPLVGLVGYELKGDPIYQEILNFFGSQTLVAKALGVSQFTFKAWLAGDSNINLDKAELLAEITKGRFHVSDFKHFKEQQKRLSKNREAYS